jgi:hypothetical protein
MQTDDEAAQIARGLTWGAQQALLWLPADGQKRLWQFAMSHRPNSGALYALRDAGLASRLHSYPLRWNATPLGLRVRAALEAMEKEKHDG